jgi:2-amino-4-hydroxy-6-hydroxymethyldihydropteridine diphosphokinase
VNAAIAVQSDWTALQTLQQLHEIEAEFGRERVQRWGQRTLDLDLIAMGDAVLPNQKGFDEWFALDPDLQAQAAPSTLVLPHPRMQDRAFVLAPLADIAAEWEHPVLQQSVAQMLAQLPRAEVDQVTPI